MLYYPVQNIAGSHLLLNTLGILAAANALLLFFSCRFVPMMGETFQVKIMQNRLFKVIYKYHAYYWWTFWLILLLHIMTAIAHTVIG